MTTIDQTRRIAVEHSLPRRAKIMVESFWLAIDSFRMSKLRFILTSLGMVIGTCSVILVATIALAGKQYILQEIQRIQLNSVEVEFSVAGLATSDQTLYSDFLTRDDERAVDAQVPGV